MQDPEWNVTAKSIDRSGFCFGNVPVIQCGIRHIPRRLIRFLFGDCAEILVLKPGETVKSVEIKESGEETIREAV